MCREIFIGIPGKTSIIEYKLMSGKLYALPYALWREIREEIQEMISIRALHQSNLPYASPMVVVKKNGSNRICVSYCQLNQIQSWWQWQRNYLRNLNNANFSQKLIELELLADTSGRWGYSNDSFCDDKWVLKIPKNAVEYKELWSNVGLWDE